MLNILMMLFSIFLLYIEGFFWTVCMCRDDPPRPFRLELASFFLMYKLHKQASLGTISFKFCVWRELLHMLERKMQRMRKRLSIANKIIRFWILVLQNPYCPLQLQKMFLVEALTNFSFAIVAKVNLDREGAEIA